MFSARLLVLSAIAFLLCAAPAHAQAAKAPRPVFAFTATEDAAALAVVERYFTKHDYISILVARRLPELENLIPRHQQYKLVARLEQLAERGEVGCNEKEPGLIIYDIEEWDATPKIEQAAPAASINRAADIIRKSQCQTFGAAPARAYLSRGPTCKPVPGPLLGEVAWENLDVLVIQAQGALRESCVKQYGVSGYIRYVEAVSRLVQQRNPNIKVFAEMSFRYSSVEQMALAIDRLEGKVTGYYLALPAARNDCLHCTAEEVESLLSRYRQPRPASAP